MQDGEMETKVEPMLCDSDHTVKTTEAEVPLGFHFGLAPFHFFCMKTISSAHIASAGRALAFIVFPSNSPLNLSGFHHTRIDFLGSGEMSLLRLTLSPKST